MKLRTSSYVLIGILVVTLFFGIFSLTYDSIKTKLFPAVVSWLGFVLAAIELRKELKDKRNQEEAMEEDTSELEITARGELVKYIRTFGWIVGLLIGIYLVGFLISVSIFMFAFLKVHGRGWLLSTGLTAIAVVLIYIGFVVALGIDLFPGVVFDMF